MPDPAARRRGSALHLRGKPRAPPLRCKALLRPRQNRTLQADFARSGPGLPKKRLAPGGIQGARRFPGRNGSSQAQALCLIRLPAGAAAPSTYAESRRLPHSGARRSFARGRTALCRQTSPTLGRACRESASHQGVFKVRAAFFGRNGSPQAQALCPIRLPAGAAAPCTCAESRGLPHSGARRSFARGKPVPSGLVSPAQGRACRESALHQGVSKVRGAFFGRNGSSQAQALCPIRLLTGAAAPCTCAEGQAALTRPPPRFPAGQPAPARRPGRGWRVRAGRRAR